MIFRKERTSGLLWRMILTAAVAALVVPAGSRPTEPQTWSKATFGPLTFELPADWTDMTVDASTQKMWGTGDPEQPDAIFSAVETDDIEEILGGLTLNSKQPATVGGKAGVFYGGTVKDEEEGRGIVFVFDEKADRDKTLALVGGFKNGTAWAKHKAVFDKIVSSVRFKGAPVTPSCVWDSYTYDPRQFATQPGGVFPMRRNFKTGKYLVHVGPAGKDGLAIPPAKWRTFGPFEVVAGNKYAAIIKKGQGGVLCDLDWETNSARLAMYSKPPAGGGGLEGYAVVYVRNDSSEQWFAICLEPVGGAGGKPELHFDQAVLRAIKSGQTVTLKAKARNIPPDVTRLKFSWYLHQNECLSSNPAGTKVNFWYNQFVEVRNGEAEGTIVMRAAGKGDSSFDLIVQDEPYNKKVFLSTSNISYKIQ